MIAARAIKTRASFLVRLSTMGRVGLRMMFFDKAKLLGTLLGVVFAVVLVNQQLGIFLGLIYKNIMFVQNSRADIWITPPSTENLTAGKTLPNANLYAAKVTPGVAWAEPLLYGGGSVKTPSGGTEPITLVGTRYPRYVGGPWNIVAGDAQRLSLPDTMFFEDSDRETLGGLNLGSMREVNGRRVTVGGFTWGLEPFGPSYAFADYETARELLHTASDQCSYVLVGVESGQDPSAVKAALQAKMPGALVMTGAEFKGKIEYFLVFKQSLGVSFGTSTLFGLIVGFVIVALSMFSSVVDNVREFGTLKAVGSTNFDLGMLLLVQSLTYAVLGSIIGLALVTRMAAGIRSAKLALVLPPWLTFGTVAVMIVVCVTASSLALLRIRKVEPAMVFR